MYVEKIVFQNRAPFENLEINFLDKGVNVLSAINGKGKTTVLSYIVDALYEMAKLGFYRSFSRNTFYRYSSSLNSLNPRDPSLVYIKFREGEDEIDYLDYRGKYEEKELEKLNAKLNGKFAIDNVALKTNLDNSSCAKLFSSKIDRTTVKNLFQKNVLTFFPAYRFEEPEYVTDVYKKHEIFSFEGRISEEIPNPIEVVSGLPTLANWILDVVLDWKMNQPSNNRDVQDDKKIEADAIPENFLLLTLSKILGLTLLGKNYSGSVLFEIGRRINAGARIGIFPTQRSERKKGIPSIFSLSSGEASLLTLFGEILRQWDKVQPGRTIEEARGIVLVDEIEKHLHIRLQKEALTKLFKIFPNIQFIVSSHSPFFNMGIADEIELQAQVVDLDNRALSVNPMNNELFREVYEMMIDENRRFAEMYFALEEKVKTLDKPILITEGKTDIKYILKAKEELQINDIDFVSLPPNKSQPSGDEDLKKLLEQLAKVPRKNKIIGIFDRDNNKIIKEIVSPYRHFGNQVYGFCIPVPEFRKNLNQEQISIEYYFTDDEIKSNLPDQEQWKRLFLGTEFGENSSRLKTDPDLCLDKPDGRGKNKVLESNKGQCVKDRDGVNHLAKKDEFAEAILNDKIKISTTSWNNFQLIFNLIRQILDDKR